MKKLLPILFLTILTLYLGGCKQDKPVVTEQWQEIELNFTSEGKYQNPYTEVDFWVEFTGPGGEKLVRPGFWYDHNIWKVRFANPLDSGVWNWKSYSSVSSDKGLDGLQGTLVSKPSNETNPLIKNGLLKIPLDSPFMATPQAEKEVYKVSKR